MSHSATIKMIADQEIKINDNLVNIHDIHTIIVNSLGTISAVSLKQPDENDLRKKLINITHEELGLPNNDLTDTELIINLIEELFLRIEKIKNHTHSLI